VFVLIIFIIIIIISIIIMRCRITLINKVYDLVEQPSYMYM